MLKEDREELLDMLSQVEQLSISAKQLINALKDEDVYNATDQLRGYMKIMKEKLDVALQHVGSDA
jgi:histidyl-tRNA synthetase